MSLSDWFPGRNRDPHGRPRRARPRRVPSCERLEARRLLTGVPAQWSVRGVGGGGALYSPVISPFNPAEMYVASDMGEQFHTTNSGASWQQLDFRQIQSNPDARAQFTENPSILYCLDFTPINGSNTARPSESTDGGQTWHLLANDPTGGSAFRFFADPSNHNRLLLSDYTNLYVSLDAGTTWKTAYANGNAGLNIAGAFFDGANIDVGTSAGLIVSANGGASFALSSIGGIPAGKAMVSFSGAKQGGVTRFFAVVWNVADVYPGVQGYNYSGIPVGSEQVYKLDAGQNSWALAMTGIAATAEPVYVATALNDVNTAYVAGGSTSSDPTVYKTTDGGQHWQSVFLTAGNQNIATGWSGSGGDKDFSYGEVPLGLVVAAGDSTHVVFTDEGYAHDSANGGTSWQALYVTPASLNPAGANTPKGKTYQDSGLDNSTAWGVNWADARNLIVANTDFTGSHSADGGNSFALFTSGNTYNTTYMTVTQPATGTVYAATSSIHDLYQSTRLTDSSIDKGTGAVLFSADKGATWQTLHNFGHPVIWVALDPTSPNRLYASVVNSASGGIYVSNDIQDGAASTWVKLTNPPRTQGHPFDVRVLNNGNLVASFSARRAGSPVNFTNSSGVFLSTDGGQTWSDRSAPNMDYWTTDVVIDPAGPTQATWYAGVYSGFGGLANDLGGLYKTTDSGLHWAQISALNVSSVTFNPTDKNEMFLTTEDQGLWYSDNIQSANPTLTQVASYPFRQPERVFYNPSNNNEIWVTSFGAGVFVGDIATASAGSLQFSAPTATVVENAGMATITVTRTGGTAGAVSVQYATSDGTAKSGTDYTTTTGTLNFADGQTSTSFSVPILNDPAADGAETVNLTLSSPGGGAALGPQSTALLTLTSNQPPVLAPILAQTVTEGGSLSFLATATDPDLPPQTLRFSLDPGGPAGASIDPVSGLCTWANPPVGNFAVTVRVTDNGSPPLSVSRLVPIAVTNLVPVLGVGSNLSLTQGTSLARPGSFADPGTETWTATVNYGDGSGTQPLTLNGKQFQLGHAYQVVGAFPVVVTVNDSNGGTGIGRFTVTVTARPQDDFDGDGRSDLGVFRPSTSQWLVSLSSLSGGLLAPIPTFGAANLFDVPVPADYDGVGHAELAVFRSSTAQWFIAGHAQPVSFGATNLFDVPVPGDYDGVGHAELAVFRPSTAQWFIGGHAQPISFGGANFFDLPLEGPIGSLAKLGLIGGGTIQGRSVDTVNATPSVVIAPALPAVTARAVATPSAPTLSTTRHRLSHGAMARNRLKADESRPVRGRNGVPARPGEFPEGPR